ncbi:leukocyte antigen CD37 isoform X5 [Callorhinus ursinus]|uniref:leukocyte antigen CD37 isoform X5 n=2 Tax=Callorhinus ursinus TaxID=34884 RepID=UPI003CD02D75
MQRWQSLAGSEVRVSVRSAAVQGWPGVLVPRVGVCKELRSPYGSPVRSHGDLGGTTQRVLGAHKFQGPSGEDVGPGQLPQPHQVPPLRFQPLLLRLSFVPLQIWSKALAISGILTMGLALLGCVGALKELRCLLGLYFGILLLLFATQITLGILISTQRMRLERRVKDIVMETIQNYRSRPEESAAEESWDYVQFQLRCCGWNSPRDWFSIPSLISNESEVHRVPCSCYNSSATNDSAVFDKLSFPQFSRLRPLARPRHSTDLCVVPANSNIYNEGCARSLQKWLHDNLISIVGICLGVGLLELSFMTLSIFLCRNLDQVYDRLARYR